MTRAQLRYERSKIYITVTIFLVIVAVIAWVAVGYFHDVSHARGMRVSFAVAFVSGIGSLLTWSKATEYA